VTGSNVTFLHSDHLGRPKFATNADGDVVWDEGITTPFGIQITAMAAQTQALMFPGQYQDLETTGAGVTLSHNWHRTYDPTLGRYLQSDPIGLAGGLNRYAYVGGNPVSWVDPTGLFLAPEFQVALDLIGKDARKPGRKTPYGRIWTGGFAIGALGGATYYYLRGSDDGCGGSYDDNSDDNDDDNDCIKKWMEEQNFCRYRKKIHQPGCLQRANERRNLCIAGIVPEHLWPPRWSRADEI